MVKKLMNLSMVAVFLGILAAPQQSGACGTSNCTLIGTRCIVADVNCGGFPTMFLLLECNGKMVLCPTGRCCGGV